MDHGRESQSFLFKVTRKPCQLEKTCVFGSGLLNLVSGSSFSVRFSVFRFTPSPDLLDHLTPWVRPSRPSHCCAPSLVSLHSDPPLSVSYVSYHLYALRPQTSYRESSLKCRGEGPRRQEGARVSYGRTTHPVCPQSYDLPSVS